MQKLLIGGALALSATCLMSAGSSAHSWYPIACCSQQDCEPIPLGGIEETRDGYRVKYASTRFGNVDEIVLHVNARQSQDGQFHGCWKAKMTSPRTICFFVPLNV